MMLPLFEHVSWFIFVTKMDKLLMMHHLLLVHLTYLQLLLLLQKLFLNLCHSFRVILKLFLLALFQICQYLFLHLDIVFRRLKLLRSKFLHLLGNFDLVLVKLSRQLVYLVRFLNLLVFIKYIIYGIVEIQILICLIFQSFES